MKKIIFIMASFLLTFGVNAQDNNRKANQRQIVQQARIAQGVASGELTRKERRLLKLQQRNIQRTKLRAKSDGVVTPGERALIRKKQNRANRAIRREKNDAQIR